MLGEVWKVTVFRPPATGVSLATGMLLTARSSCGTTALRSNVAL